MKKRRRPLQRTEANAEYEYARLIALRALQDEGRFRKAFEDYFERERERFNFVGTNPIVEWLGLYPEGMPETMAPAILRRDLKEALRAAGRAGLASTCRQAIDWLGGIIRLEPVDCAIAELLVVAHQNDDLVRILDSVTGKSMREDCALLADILGFGVAEVGQALGKRGNLARYGFLRYDHFYDGFLSRLEMQRELAAVLSSPYSSVDELVSAFLNPVEAAQLAEEDVPHLAAHLEILRAVLPNALKDGRKGINILFYGEPGTGKTQVAALLARLAALDGYRIIKPDETDAQSGTERLGYYQIVQRMLVDRRSSVLVFDEFEDVVPDNDPFSGLFGRGSRKSAPMKSWLTQVLEENPVPTIWISNSIRHIDRALLRRFTYSVEFRTPPATVRRRILAKAVEGLEVSARWIDRTAGIANLSPAMVRNAATIAALAGCGDTARTEALLDRTIEGNLRASGCRPERSAVTPVTRYDLSFVNATVEPESVLASLRRTGRGTLCFFGPPGTGKSAFGGHMATQLDRPLMIRRASDLLSMWVGGTEENIARMFDEAREENAVLLIDEADSFLGDRAGAQRSWEVTQVNEMLSQIEHFEGVLICTTNRLDHMDPAVLRRFSHKVGFEYLKPAQRTAMFFSEFGVASDAAHDAPFDEATHRPQVDAALSSLPNLAAGDFATVRRQFDAAGGALTLDDVLAALRAECEIKPDRPRRGIGFA